MNGAARDQIATRRMEAQKDLVTQRLMMLSIMVADPHERECLEVALRLHKETKLYLGRGLDLSQFTIPDIINIWFQDHDRASALTIYHALNGLYPIQSVRVALARMLKAGSLCRIAPGQYRKVIT